MIAIALNKLLSFGLTIIQRTSYGICIHQDMKDADSKD